MTYTFTDLEKERWEAEGGFCIIDLEENTRDALDVVHKGVQGKNDLEQDTINRGMKTSLS